MSRSRRSTKASVRIATYTAVAFPIGLAALLFLASATSSTSTSGAGVTEANRPVIFVFLAAFGAATWVLGTSAMFCIVAAPSLLPLGEQTARAYLFGDYAAAPPEVMATRMRHPVVSNEESSPSVRQLLEAGFLKLPLMMFCAPWLLGYLFQPVVYRPAEAVAVAMMGLVVIGWSVLLVIRASSPLREREA
jgi:hypothetical protein